MLGLLWVMKHVALHVLPIAASSLTEAGESTWTVTVCSEIHPRSLEMSVSDVKWWWPGVIRSHNTNTWEEEHGLHEAATLWAHTGAHCLLLYWGYLTQKGPFTLPVAHFQHLDSELQALSPKPCYTETGTAYCKKKLGKDYKKHLLSP